MVEDCHVDYDFYQLFSEPSDFGFGGTARYRTWLMGAQRESTSWQSDPFDVYNDIVARFRDSDISTQVNHYLVASDTEIKMEAAQLALDRGLDSFKPGETPLEYLLNTRERVTLDSLNQKYLVRYGADPSLQENLVYFLGDSADYQSWSAVSGKIPTFRLNSRTGKYWLPARGRWLTAKERLTALGFPTTSEVAASMQVPPIGAVDVQRASDICGNSMHFQTCGIMQLLTLACFGPS